MHKTVVIKKYNNRRLYDTDKNTYVTLSTLSTMIKEGRSIEVVDAKTKEDVTAFTLTQIILEEARKRDFLLPIPLLHLMIRYGETLLSDFFGKHLQQILKNYIAYKTSVDRQFSSWLDLGTGFSKDSQHKATLSAPFKSILDIFPWMKEDKPKGMKKKTE